MKLSRLFAFTLLIPALLPAVDPPSGWREGYVVANGIRIHYWRGGEGKQPLVFAHGSSDDSLCWAPFGLEFASKYDIIAFDARGHGLSDPPKAGDPPDAQVEDLAGLIRELKLEKPILMGHSMGSASVAWFAAKYPDVPRAVILEDPNLAKTRPASWNTLQDPAAREKLRAGILARNNKSFADLEAECQKNSPKWGAAECAFWAPSKRRHHPDTALVGYSGRPLMMEIFPKITAPVLILKADAQGELRQTNEEVTQLLKQGTIVHVPGAGHNVRRENREESLRVTRAFLDKYASAGSSPSGSGQRQ
jgi:pimeloyl-ACP methyl ester carboxylesterase